MTVALMWFRNDLRLQDNAALAEAVEAAEGLLCVYLIEPESYWARGAASRVWLHHSLLSLRESLRQAGNDLLIIEGEASDHIPALCQRHKARQVFWSRRYRPDHIASDKALFEQLNASGIRVHSLAGEMLHQPWSLQTGSGGPYRVFTPFWKQLRQRLGQLNARSLPATLPPTPKLDYSNQQGLDRLLPDKPWACSMMQDWPVGEMGARKRLDWFLQDSLGDYATQRDRPDRDGTSQLSPALHFGEIAPHRIIQRAEEVVAADRAASKGAEVLMSELGWREFSRHLLYHFPQMPDRPLNSKFEDFPWSDKQEQALKAWRRGQTGIPIVDAGMRQLWASGWMHNRVRMIVGSFLCKNLLVPWQKGEYWFWDTLVDADLANNSQGWQWIGGCGADAAPYFRVFNPVLQSEKFDPQSRYIARWLPQLAGLPAKERRAPWLASSGSLSSAGVRLGENYPEPVVDLKRSRERALEAWQKIR